MRLLVIGPPGAGKGTQARRIAAHLGVRHVSSGDIFRRHVAEGTAQGRAVARYLDDGDLVPDDLVLAMVGGAVVEASGEGGYVLDGFPRTVEQAETAYRLGVSLGVTVHAVIELEVGEDELYRRLQGRSEAEGRTDDSVDTVRHRLQVYEEKTRPLRDYYLKRRILHRIDGARPPDEVTAEVLAVLEQVRATEPK